MFYYYYFSYTFRLTVTSSCPMDLQYFPMDRQLCTVEIESFGYTMTDIRYKWREGNSVGISQDLELPQFKVAGHRQSSPLLFASRYNKLLKNWIVFYTKGAICTWDRIPKTGPYDVLLEVRLKMVDPRGYSKTSTLENTTNTPAPELETALCKNINTLYGVSPSDIDKYSRVVFPVCFVCFNLMYWIIYLHISDLLSEDFASVG
ncbi:gamma-aminobutyric acid receptor subunit beta-like [Limulus polyphemus]|uniref:Gamma-aminobutyric acid receptor subunit beta-like n=1 Tax=Limulus polyphemus TaxID=6850 RepID=A0ABM1C1M2_LIMPO|nr:gamma-aminobutyric acid receptor subunit beta-like [Limulus polyphemus]